VADASSRNAIVRFEGAIQKRYPDIIESYNQETFRAEEREEVSDLFGFIDDMYVPSISPRQRLIESDERDPDTASEAGSRRPRGSKGRGVSRDWSEAPSEITVTTASEPDEEDEDQEEEEEDQDPTPRKPAPAPAPKRSAKPTRRSSVRPIVKREPVEEEEEETDGDGDDVEGLLDEDSSEEDEMLL
jgi:condensin complex subunit 3